MVLSTGAVASAQRAAILRPGGDTEVAARWGAVAVHAIERELAAVGVEVTGEEELRQREAAAGLSRCDEPACGPALVRAGVVDLAVVPALWPRNVDVRTGQQRVLVTVVLLDGEGRQVSGRGEGSIDQLPASEASQVVRASASEASRAAWAAWGARSGARVRVLGSPEGASIGVDAEPWGTIPHEGVVEPGRRRFVVSAAGRTTERRTVEVSLGGDVLELRFDLGGGAGSGLDVGRLAVGIALSAAGIGLAVPGLYGLGLGASCDGTFRCERGALEPSIGWVVAGGVALVVGVVLLILSGGG